MKELDRS